MRNLEKTKIKPLSLYEFFMLIYFESITRVSDLAKLRYKDNG